MKNILIRVEYIKLFIAFFYGKIESSIHIYFDNIYIISKTEYSANSDILIKIQ